MEFADRVVETQGNKNGLRHLIGAPDDNTLVRIEQR